MFRRFNSAFKGPFAYHSIAYAIAGACTNQAESFFSRLRRAEIGIHHSIAGPYLARYAAEMAWREDHRRKDTGEQFRCVATLAMASGKSQLHRLLAAGGVGGWGCVAFGLGEESGPRSNDLTRLILPVSII